jgi:hypothetical protein
MNLYANYALLILNTYIVFKKKKETENKAAASIDNMGQQTCHEVHCVFECFKDLDLYLTIKITCKLLNKLDNLTLFIFLSDFSYAFTGFDQL